MSAVRSNRMREIVPFALVAVAVAAFVAMELANHGFPINSYKAFYCGGHAILQGANPYLMEPLRSCEHAAYVSPSFPSFAVEPAPLPGYSLLALAAIAWLPPGRRTGSSRRYWSPRWRSPVGRCDALPAVPLRS